MVRQRGTGKEKLATTSLFPLEGSEKAARTLPGNRTGSLGNYLRLWIYSDLNAKHIQWETYLEFCSFPGLVTCCVLLFYSTRNTPLAQLSL